MEQELSDVLVFLADRLGIAAEVVFGIFVGAQPLIGVIAIAANILGILGGILGYNRCSGVYVGGAHLVPRQNVYIL